MTFKIATLFRLHSKITENKQLILPNQYHAARMLRLKNRLGLKPTSRDAPASSELEERHRPHALQFQPHQNSLNHRFMIISTLFTKLLDSSTGRRTFPRFRPYASKPVAVANMGFLTTSPNPPN